MSQQSKCMYTAILTEPYRNRNRPSKSQLPSINDSGFLGNLLYSLGNKHRAKGSLSRVWCDEALKEHDIDPGFSTAQYTWWTRMGVFPDDTFIDFREHVSFLLNTKLYREKHIQF